MGIVNRYIYIFHLYFYIFYISISSFSHKHNFVFLKLGKVLRTAEELLMAIANNSDADLSDGSDDDEIYFPDADFDPQPSTSAQSDVNFDPQPSTSGKTLY